MLPLLLIVTTALGFNVLAFTVVVVELKPVKQSRLPSFEFDAYKVEVAEPETLMAAVPVPLICIL